MVWIFLHVLKVILSYGNKYFPAKNKFPAFDPAPKGQKLFLHSNPDRIICVLSDIDR